MKEIALRTIRNFMQQAMIDIMSADAYGLSVDTFSEGARQRIETLAQKMADDYNTVARNHNELALGRECTDASHPDYYIQAVIKENLSDPQVFFEVTNSYTPHGVYYVLEQAQERMSAKTNS